MSFVPADTDIDPLVGERYRRFGFREEDVEAIEVITPNRLEEVLNQMARDESRYHVLYCPTTSRIDLRKDPSRYLSIVSFGLQLPSIKITISSERGGGLLFSSPGDLYPKMGLQVGSEHRWSVRIEQRRDPYSLTDNQVKLTPLSTSLSINIILDPDINISDIRPIEGKSIAQQVREQGGIKYRLPRLEGYVLKR